jgi:hypothetical protein
VRGKLAVDYEFAGAQQVKNIAEPVPTFRVTLDAGEGSKRKSKRLRSTATQAGSAHRHRRYLLAFLIPVTFFVLLKLFAGLEEGSSQIWFQWPSMLIGLVVGLLWLRML